MVNPNKLKAGIHARAHQLGLDEETRRGFQRRLVGKDSCKDMTPVELWRVLWALNQVGGSYQRSAISDQRHRTGRDERQPEELATVEQIRMIQHLFDDLQIAGVGLARMNLCRRVCRQPWPQTREEANKVIEALKAMRARGWRARDAQG